MTAYREALSVIIITLNEAHDIGACLSDVSSLADEIIVVDAGSTDATVKICQSFGALVVTKDWLGFGPQKNRALALAGKPWVLSLDADERVTTQLKESIEEVLAGRDQSSCIAYAISRRSQFCGCWANYSGWSPDWVVRLFRRDAARFSDNIVHERLIFEGSTGRLNGQLLHYSYRSRKEVEDKTIAYARAAAKTLRTRRIGALLPFMHGGFAFVRTFMLRAGFLDGLTGLGIARMNARSTFLKYYYARRVDPTIRDSNNTDAIHGTWQGLRIGLSCQALGHSGGLERYVRDIIGAMARRQIYPIVFARKFDKTLPEYSLVDIQTIRVNWMPRALRDAAFSWRLQARRVRSQIDIVIACNRVDSGDIVICGGTYPGALRYGRNKPKWNDGWQIALERRIYQNAGVIIAHSKMLEQEIHQHFGIDLDKIHVIYPPVRSDRFMPMIPSQREAMRAQLGIPEGHAVFVFVANTGKGFELLRAYFRATSKPILLLVTGRPPADLSPNIRSLGYRTDMQYVFGAADFTIIPAPYEPFGLVGVESILCGTPVLIAGNVGCSEVIRKDAQWRFSHLSAESFSAAIEQALTHWQSHTARLTQPNEYLLYDYDVASHTTRLLALASELADHRCT
ncbi:glycosyltransferase [Candidatus Vallotia tarda]|uniref:Alpha-L-glycero-D-manno-heptose beta-1, 4-glucosyltransferase n=1 Tax=Candidatus Vallotiella hemipterorum TaxID=1177213 RepID=A0A916NL65_9BURK|nr:glycosyltransferase [Candidatus Vallotia tarda]CAG7598008.1 Alpha-L-glycero-D-manno-heptose beta-1, 4-glucosyltransferase [Candidatus Vallotia tarda]